MDAGATERKKLVLTLPPQIPNGAIRDREDLEGSNDKAAVETQNLTLDEDRMLMHDIAKERDRANRKERIILAVSKLYGLATVVLSALDTPETEVSARQAKNIEGLLFVKDMLTRCHRNHCGMRPA